MQPPEDPNSEEFNPFQAPSAEFEPVEVRGGTNAEEIRREHLTHEASVKSIGSL